MGIAFGLLAAFARSSTVEKVMLYFITITNP